MEIGRRLRLFRKEMMISQTAFALKAGTSRENLAKYEFGLVPLPWEAGDAICRAHNINQRWLVTGEEPPRSLYLEPDAETLKQVRPRSRFSDICEVFLKNKKVQFDGSQALVQAKVILKAYDEAMKHANDASVAPDMFELVGRRMRELQKALQDLEELFQRRLDSKKRR